MLTQLIKSITFFQQLLSSQFSTLNQRLVDKCFCRSVICLGSLTRIKCVVYYNSETAGYFIAFLRNLISADLVFRALNFVSSQAKQPMRGQNIITQCATD